MGRHRWLAWLVVAGVALVVAVGAAPAAAGDPPACDVGPLPPCQVIPPPTVDPGDPGDPGGPPGGPVDPGDPGDPGGPPVDPGGPGPGVPEPVNVLPRPAATVTDGAGEMGRDVLPVTGPAGVVVSTAVGVGLVAVGVLLLWVVARRAGRHRRVLR